jgi:hypothetical protein
MATNNVFRSSTIYGILRNSDNTTASPNVLANAIFDRDVDVTGKVVTDRINSKTGRIDMSGNIIDISGNTIYLGHTGNNVYIKDVLYAGGDVTLAGTNAFTGTNTFNTNLPTSTATPTTSTQLITKAYGDSNYASSSGSVTSAGNNNFTGTNTFNAASTIKNSLNFTNGSNPLTAKIEPVDMGGASVMKITSKGLLYIDCNNIVPDPDPYIPYFYYQGFYYGNPTTTQPYTIESNGGLTLNAIKLKLQSSGDINLATASVTRSSTPTLTDNSLELATTAFVKGQNYITSSALTPYAPLASPTLTGTPAAPTAATSTNTTQIATTAFVKNQGYATLASPTLTGTPAAPTALTADNSTTIATTAFVKAQNYLTSASLSAYALLASPTFTGTPAAPTAATSTNTTQIATTAFVKDQGYATLASPTLTGTPLAPTALTADSSTTIATTAFVKAQNYLTSASLSAYALLASPTFTGTPAAPTAATSTNTTQIATTAFVKDQGYATLASPTLTGTPAAPTATAGTNTTQIATTAFVLGQSFITSAALSAYALLASPTFTGTPAAPTAATSTNTTQIATTAFVKNQAYATLADPALTGNPTATTQLAADNSTRIATTAFVKLQNYLTSASLSAYALLASPTFTGTPAAPTAATSTNTTQIATTAFVKDQGYATLASPTLTGTPAAPTAAVGTNTTQIATTAFVLANGVTLAGTNAFTGTNTFNSNLPTSTQTPSSSTQLITKAYADATYPSAAGFASLSAANTFTATNNFSTLNSTAIVITDATTKPASAGGSLRIKHNTSGGSSSIVFPSTADGSEYGFIQYDDNRGSGGENAKLTIGTINDSNDDLYLSPSGTTYITSGLNVTGATTLTGVSMYRAGYNTIAIGYDNLPASSTSNYDNFCFGTGVMKYMTTGNNNVGIGNYAFGLATTSNESVAVGIQALSQVLTGGQNTAVGFCASQVTTGSSNTSIGNLAGLTLTSGTRNTYIGSESGGGSITTGSYNTAIGDNSGKHNYSNTTCIGYNSVATANNQIVLGTTSETTISKGGIEILESKNLNFRQNSSGNTSTIQFLNNAGSVLALIYGSTSSNALNFDAYSSSLTNGFRFLFGGTQVAKISPTGQLSAGQPQTWAAYGTSGGNAYTPGSSTRIGSTSNVPSSIYLNGLTTYGGANASDYNTSTATFTASVAGLYNFQFFMFLNSSPAANNRWLAARGTAVAASTPGSDFQYVSFNHSYLSSSNSQHSVQVTYYMAVGQTFYWSADAVTPLLYYGPGHTTALITKIY